MPVTGCAVRSGRGGVAGSGRSMPAHSFVGGTRIVPIGMTNGSYFQPFGGASLPFRLFHCATHKMICQYRTTIQRAARAASIAGVPARLVGADGGLPLKHGDREVRVDPNGSPAFAAGCGAQIGFAEKRNRSRNPFQRSGSSGIHPGTALLRKFIATVGPLPAVPVAARTLPCMPHGLFRQEAPTGNR